MAGKRVSRKVATTNEGVQEPPSWFRSDWFWGLTLTLFVILAYAPIWHAGFIWDDDIILTANPCIVGPLALAGAGLARASEFVIPKRPWLKSALCAGLRVQAHCGAGRDAYATSCLFTSYFPRPLQGSLGQS